MFLRRDALLGLLALCAPAILSAPCEADEPRNFLNLIGGFNDVSTVDVNTFGDNSTWLGDTSGQPFSVSFDDLEQKNSTWAGVTLGRWLMHNLVSLGATVGCDFYPAVVKEQLSQPTEYILGGQPQVVQNQWNKFETEVEQIVPTANLLLAMRVKMFRIWAGGGPGWFMSDYSFTVKNNAGDIVGKVTASDAKVGFNVIFGGDLFISRRLAVFAEAKYSQVDDLEFTPDKDSDLAQGRTVTEAYDRILTKRIGAGLSYNF
jgi:opacity protein-like surface antigen